MSYNFTKESNYNMNTSKQAQNKPCILYSNFQKVIKMGENKNINTTFLVANPAFIILLRVDVWTKPEVNNLFLPKSRSKEKNINYVLTH